jgi:RNA polymerase sigma-70 factor (ECF subfamily)
MLQNREDAEDAVQEAFRHAWVNLSKFRGDALFLTWLTRIVINESLIIIRGRKRKHEPGAGESSEATLAEAVDSAPNPEKRCENHEVQIAIHQAISSLHSKLRSVVLLRELNGCTTREAAKELGITISAAKARMHRARHDMRVQIERRHFAAPAAFLYR